MLRVESYAVAKHIDWTTLYNWIKCVTHVVAQPVTYVAVYSRRQPYVTILSGRGTPQENAVHGSKPTFLSAKRYELNTLLWHSTGFRRRGRERLQETDQ